MSDAAPPPRPRQLVLAAGVVIGGSAFLLAAVFDALGNLQSVDTRAQLSQLVSSAAGRDLGLTLDEAVSAMRAALSLTAVCAAVALVLGIFVLQRHRGARIALSVVAVPLLVTAPLVGGFLGALVAVATLMLWNGPAGDWYAGRPIRETAGSRAARSSTSAPPVRSPQRPPASQAPTPPPAPVSPVAPTARPEAPSTTATSTAPEATQGFGEPPTTTGPEHAPVPLGVPQPSAPWAPHPTAAAAVGVGVDAPVPAPVRIACLLTWVFSGSVALMYLAAAVTLVVDRGAIVDRVVDTPAWRETGLSESALVPLLWFGVLLFLAWSLGAMVLAFFTWRRHDWARYLLAASATVALLVGAIAFPVGLLHQIACAATVGTLFAPTARAWFAGRRGPRPPTVPPPPSNQPPSNVPGPRTGPW